jgi:hypothetical protein
MAKPNTSSRGGCKGGDGLLFQSIQELSVTIVAAMMQQETNQR